MALTESIDSSMRASCLAPFEPDQLWQRAHEPLFWLDPMLKLVWVNHAWENLTGYPAESVVGLTCRLTDRQARVGWRTWRRAFIRPPSRSWVSRRELLSHIYHASGEPIWRRIDFWPLRDEDDSSIGFLGLVHEADCRPSVAR